jgi:hypothetical protein
MLMEKYLFGIGKQHEFSVNGKLMIMFVSASYGILMKLQKLCLADGTEISNFGIKLLI